MGDDAETATADRVEVYDLGTPTVTMQRDGYVATVTLNRPDRLNAITVELLDGLERAWRIAGDRAEIRVVVLTGAGRAFCAGADIDEYLSAPPTLDRLLNPLRDLRPDRGLDLRKPVVAAVDGPCLGGGLTLLLATDIRFATPRSTFGTPETGWGVLACYGGTQRLVRQIPYAVAMSMLVGGERLDAQDAHRVGLVSHLTEPGAARAAAQDYAQAIALRAPLATQATKELALRAHDLPLEAGIRLEDTMVRLLQDTADAAEGIAAWQQSRAPRYQGR